MKSLKHLTRGWTALEALCRGGRLAVISFHSLKTESQAAFSAKAEIAYAHPNSQFMCLWAKRQSGS
jgi:16S rRNA C1402 N4-methylase RsmH